MTDIYDLDLTDEGRAQAQGVLDSLQAAMQTAVTNAASDALGALYADYPKWIDTDAWGNFRQALFEGLSDYSENRDLYDFRAVRAKLLEEHREDIIADLDQDHLRRIEELEQQLEVERRLRRDY